jgi:hypothetical protein
MELNLWLTKELFRSELCVYEKRSNEGAAVVSLLACLFPRGTHDILLQGRLINGLASLVESQ